jgi:hypothetical protein
LTFDVCEAVEECTDGVKRLFVLPPANTTDKPLVVQQNTLSPKTPAPAGESVVVDIELIEIGSVRICNDRILHTSRTRPASAVEIVDDQMTYVVELAESRPVAPGAGTKIETQAQRRRIRIISKPSLIDMLETIPECDTCFAAGDRLGKAESLLFVGERRTACQNQYGRQRRPT